MPTFKQYKVKAQVVSRLGRTYEDEEYVRTQSVEDAIITAIDILTQQGEEMLSVEVREVK